MTIMTFRTIDIISYIRVFFEETITSENSNFGMDLDGSKYCVFLFPPTILIITMGPKKYKISNPKFILVQRGPEAEIVTKSTLLQ